MPRQGGRYEAKKGGKPKLVERTQEHKQGHAPRDAKGARLDRPAAGVKAVSGPTQGKES